LPPTWHQLMKINNFFLQTSPWYIHVCIMISMKITNIHSVTMEELFKFKNNFWENLLSSTYFASKWLCWRTQKMCYLKISQKFITNIMAPIQLLHKPKICKWETIFTECLRVYPLKQNSCFKLMIGVAFTEKLYTLQCTCTCTS
jgi:hypothetical protein